MTVILRSSVFAIVCFMIGIFSTPVFAADDSDKGNPIADIPLRPIGPAITSGRISDFAFYPDGDHEFLVATSSGGLWKTDNGGITWNSLMDKEASFALGVVELDPNDSKTIWVGSGENNAQRSVAYGDGVYKSIDGGASWENVGLKDSGHISQIWINPDDSSDVLVAAQGPLWNDGGDRGLYRTNDGGATWSRILNIDEHTGVNEFVVDPRNHDNIVASSYQRRRHVWVLINGGPGSAIHKSTDGGKTWRMITAGLPSDHMGRIGIAGAPSNPDMIYAIIEGNEEEQGVYRSTDFGNNWSKRSSYVSGSPQYYNELIIDPHNAERVYSMNTFTMLSNDGGESFSPISNNWRHVDDHALWIDPRNTNHLYVGGDGGIYETWDRGDNWRHVRNLNITQFYRIQPDNAEPFYNVCGGTQDNNSLCGPSRTTVVHGVTNSDWNIVLGGDGYEPQIDPDDPNIIYPQYQYGGLARYDRRTQERLYITPRPASGENDYKWNWNTPLLISPHNSKRLYYAAEYLFRSDDRGDSWKKISPDLTRQIDRNQLDVMGRVWGVDTIAKNNSTSMYGSAIMISESPLQEGLIYVSTDDGVVNVTEDGGANWRRTEKFRGVPGMSYIDDVLASNHDADVAYAVFDNHKRGDFKPYVMKSTNRGESWKLINGDLPARGSAHTIVEDHVDPNLLFVGTEFGLFVTQNGGGSWTQLKNNFPTIAVRDIEIQQRENDLVVGTFGRGIYILDDYSALRTSENNLGSEQLFPVRDPWLYIEGDLWDSREKGSMGEEFFATPNPAFGAVFTYYLKDGVKSQQAIRREGEIEIEKAGGDTPYPAWDTLRAEDQEEDPALYLMVRDTNGALVRQVAGDAEKGMHRSAWDLRLPPPDPIDLADTGERPYWESDPVGPLALPGDYTVRLAMQKDGILQEVGDSQTFTVKALAASPEISENRRELQTFQLKVTDIQRAVAGTTSAAEEMGNRITHMQSAIVQTTAVTDADRATLRSLSSRLANLNTSLNGDSTIGGRNEPAPMSISSRVNNLYYGLVYSQASIADSYRDSYQVATTEFTAALNALRSLEQDISALETALEVKGAPWTPGRIPQWSSN